MQDSVQVSNLEQKIIKKEKMAFKTKVVLVVLLVALLIGVPPGLSKQSPKESREDLYSIWIKLSMMGHNQSEIEGILAEISQQQLQHLKNRLRRDVLNTLIHLNLSNVQYMDSSGISVLIESHQKALEKNTKVIIKEVSKSVLKVIMMAKLEQILNLE
mgnify:CR=1 FL=1